MTQKLYSGIDFCCHGRVQFSSNGGKSFCQMHNVTGEETTGIVLQTQKDKSYRLTAFFHINIDFEDKTFNMHRPLAPSVVQNTR